MTKNRLKTNTNLPEFQKLQYEFTAHIRDPEAVPSPDGLEDRRMEIYRELFFNNVNSFLENGFPVLRTHYDNNAWQRLVRAFFSTHDSHSPWFVDISKEFILYLQSEHQTTNDDPAYLFELAHFEWAEVALMVDQEESDWDNINPHGDLLEAMPVLSPTAYCLSYQWPVHEISADYQPTQQPEQPSFVLIHRDKDDDIQFVSADPVTARIMELLQLDEDHNTDGPKSKPASGKALLTQLATEMQHPNPEEALHDGHRILLKFHHAGIVVGTKK